MVRRFFVLSFVFILGTWGTVDSPAATITATWCMGDHAGPYEKSEAIHKLMTAIKEEVGTGYRDGQFFVAPGDVEKFAKQVKDVHGEEIAMPLLLEVLDDKRQSTAARMLTVLAIGMFGQKARDAVPVLTRILEETMDDAPRYYGLPRSERQTVRISDGTQLRAFSCYALGAIGQDRKRIIAVLQKAPSDPESYVAHWAGQALNRLGAPPKAWPHQIYRSHSVLRANRRGRESFSMGNHGWK